MSINSTMLLCFDVDAKNAMHWLFIWPNECIAHFCSIDRSHFITILDGCMSHSIESSSVIIIIIVGILRFVSPICNLFSSHWKHHLPLFNIENRKETPNKTKNNPFGQKQKQKRITTAVTTMAKTQPTCKVVNVICTEKEKEKEVKNSMKNDLC